MAATFNSGASSHPYGLDGPLTAWANDINNNGVLQDSSGNTEAGEHAYLYVGMRRGGNNYYALDVTNRSTPELKWMIQCGQGNFARLAQTFVERFARRHRRSARGFSRCLPPLLRRPAHRLAVLLRRRQPGEPALLGALALRMIIKKIFT